MLARRPPTLLEIKIYRHAVARPDLDHGAEARAGLLAHLRTMGHAAFPALLHHLLRSQPRPDLVPELRAIWSERRAGCDPRDAAAIEARFAALP